MSGSLNQNSDSPDISVDLILRLSALLLILTGVASGLASKVLIIPAALIAISPTHVRSQAAWWSLTAIVVLGSVWHWYDVSNHHWVILAWIVACAIGVSQADAGRFLSTNAKTMLAIVFMVGGIQKLIFGAWYDGLYLELDASGNPWTAMLFGFTELGRQQHMAAQLLIQTGILDEAAFYITGTESTRPWMVAISWVTVGVEVAIGVLFALKSSPRNILWRTSGLLVFVWLVYPVAPVTGFAWILLVLTAATLPREHTSLRRACWFSFAWVLFCPYINDADEILERLLKMF
jgi:hypothetical protein